MWCMALENAIFTQQTYNTINTITAYINVHAINIQFNMLPMVITINYICLLLIAEPAKLDHTELSI